MSYRITREIRPDCQAIIFEWSDRQSEQELLRDFSQLKHLGRHAFRHHRLSAVNLVLPLVAFSFRPEATGLAQHFQSFLSRQFWISRKHSIQHAQARQNFEKSGVAHGSVFNAIALKLRLDFS
jgi:hypothetical protein